MQNSADRTPWPALARYGSGALSAVVAIDGVAIGYAPAEIAALVALVDASNGVTVLFHLRTAVGAAEREDMSGRGAGRDDDPDEQCRDSRGDAFVAHFDLPTGSACHSTSAEVSEALRSRRRSMVANLAAGDVAVVTPRVVPMAWRRRAVIAHDRDGCDDRIVAGPRSVDRMIDDWIVARAPPVQRRLVTRHRGMMVVVMMVGSVAAVPVAAAAPPFAAAVDAAPVPLIVEMIAAVAEVVATILAATMCERGAAARRNQRRERTAGDDAPCALRDTEISHGTLLDVPIIVVDPSRRRMARQATSASIDDRIEPERDAAGEQVLALLGERMKLRAVGVAQEPLKSCLSIEPSAPGRLERFLHRRQHMPGDDRLAHQNGVGDLKRHRKIQVVGKANHVVDGKLRRRQLIGQLAEQIRHEPVALALLGLIPANRRRG